MSRTTGFAARMARACQTLLVALTTVVLLTGITGSAHLPSTGQANDSTREAAVRLDHLPIAVPDLDSAVEHWQQSLGFAIKPGRLHGNSIDNAHIRLPDGSALELITATRPADELAAFYVALIETGGGAGALALEPLDFDAATAAIARAGIRHEITTGPYYRWLTFEAGSTIDWLFLAETTSRPPDLPEHLAHPNGALRLAGVRIEGEVDDAERALLRALGARPAGPSAPGTGDGTARWTLASGDLLFARTSGRPRITGVVIEVDNLDRTTAALRVDPAAVSTGRDDLGRFARVHPASANGIALEFREAGSRN